MTARFIRRRGLVALGLVLFVSGVGLLALGLYSLVGGSGPFLAKDSASSQADRSSGGLNLPVTVPYNRPPPGISPTTETPQTPPVVNNTPPLRMVIESIGVDAAVITLGLDENSVPQVPDWTNSSDAGKVVSWYDFSAKPGQGSNAVFAGHVTWNRAPAVFWQLKDVKPGDTIKLVTEEGKELVYEVFASFAVDPNDPNSVRVMDPADQDIITLITCGGTWLPNPSEPFGGNYTHRTIVQARLLSASVGGLGP